MSNAHLMPLMLSELQIRWGARIRELRKERELSLNVLARVAEIDPGQLSRIENGLTGVGDEYRFKIATALGCRVEEIFTYPDGTRGDD